MFSQNAAILPDFNRLLKFFPGADIKKMSEIEDFHSQMATVLEEEFTSARQSISAMIDIANKELSEAEHKMRELGMTPKISKAVLDSYADKKNEITKLERANIAYDTMATLKADADDMRNRFETLQDEQMATLQNDINIKMNALNDYIYDSEKKSPVLNLKKTSSYTFFTPDDTGTGTQYKGLVVFDLSLLELTELPSIIHDSVLLKQIADEPLERIMSLYSNSNKQVFIALDKKSAYTAPTQKILEENEVLHLSPGGNELFGWSWNVKDDDNSEYAVIE